MAIKYFCDVCGKETRNPKELEEVTRDSRDGKESLKCDICKKCADKMFKPVKEYHSTVTVSFQDSSTWAYEE